MAEVPGILRKGQLRDAGRRLWNLVQRGIHSMSPSHLPGDWIGSLPFPLPKCFGHSGRSLEAAWQGRWQGRFAVEASPGKSLAHKLCVRLGAARSP